MKTSHALLISSAIWHLGNHGTISQFISIVLLLIGGVSMFLEPRSVTKSRESNHF